MKFAILETNNFHIIDHFNNVPCEFSSRDEAEEMINEIKSNPKFTNLNLIAIEQN